MLLEPRLRVGFAGTPEFARTALQSILEAGYDVGIVLTQPDRPAGRGMKLQPSPVKALAMERGIHVAQPQGLRLDGRFSIDAASAMADLQAAEVDVLVVAAYGLILPRWVLALPRLGCLNIHASLLPRWRGAAPIHRAIEAGDSVTGICIMQMDEGLDTGDVLLSESIPIGPLDSTGSLHDRLAILGGGLIVQALKQAQAGELRSRPQPSEGVTYAHKIEKAEALVDWSAPADLIERRIRAFDPFPGAYTRYRSEALKIWRARVVSFSGPQVPGQVVDAGMEGLRVVCGDSALEVLELQLPGGRRLACSQFFQGRSPVEWVGACLG